ncbi:MAG: hypothetical protein HZC36_04735 [Armatimonadetes bacterium]|nr:hypothetical protein [Armatimonadota bacterium]
MFFFFASPPVDPWAGFWPKVLEAALGSLLPFVAAIGAVFLGSTLARRKDADDRRVQARKDYYLARLSHLTEVLGHLYTIQSAALRARHAAINKVAMNAVGLGTQYAQFMDELGTAALRAIPLAERYGPLPKEVGTGIQGLAGSLEQFFHHLLEGLNYEVPADEEILVRSIQAVRRDLRTLVAWEELCLAEVTGDTTHLLLNRSVLAESQLALPSTQTLDGLAASTPE